MKRGVRRGSWRHVGAAAALLASVVGCQWLVGLNDVELGSPDAEPPDAMSEAAVACDAAVCSNTCVKLASDPKNCGACGHDCLGGACKASVCQPVVLATGQTSPMAIALNSTYVFWVNFTTPGGIMRCAKSGCPNGPTQLATASNPRTVAADETNVYWGAQDQSISQCPVGGCINNAPTPVVTNQGSPIYSIAIDATNIYWMRYTGSTSGCIRKCTNDGGCNGSFTNVTTNLGSPLRYLAVDNTSAYLTTSDGFVCSCSLASCNVTCTIGGQTNPTAIVQDSSRIYWTISADGGAVQTNSKSTLQNPNPNPLVLADQVVDLALDTNNIYYTRDVDGTVWSCPLTGGTPNRLASSQASPFGVAVDSTAVYWTNLGDGTIMKLAK